MPYVGTFCVLIFYAMHRFLLSKTTFESFHESLILCSCICFVTNNIVAFLWVICHFSLSLFQVLLSSLVFSHFLAYFKYILLNLAWFSTYTFRLQIHVFLICWRCSLFISHFQYLILYIVVLFSVLASRGSWCPFVCGCLGSLPLSLHSLLLFLCVSDKDTCHGFRAHPDSLGRSHL